MKEEIIGIFTFGITFFGSSHNTMIDCFGFFLIDQPIVPFPSVAIPLNTLLAYILRLWHTGIIVESTNVMPVHLPKAPRLRKNMSWKNTRLSNSTKRLYDTAFGKYDFIVPLMKNR